MAKLENEDAINDLNKILEFADAVMVPRGQLGTVLPIEKRCKRSSQGDRIYRRVQWMPRSEAQLELAPNAHYRVQEENGGADTEDSER